MNETWFTEQLRIASRRTSVWPDWARKEAGLPILSKAEKRKTAMSMYYEGYSEAVRNVGTMDLPALLALLDDLYGRDNVEDEGDMEQVRAEAYRQVQRDFTDTSSPEYEQVEFWKKVHAAQR